MTSTAFATPSFLENEQEQQQQEKQQDQQQQQPSRPIRLYQPNRNRSIHQQQQQTATYEPTIAIVGRPNVGKSALVNRLSGTHHQNKGNGAIVADQSGITRDRTYKRAEFLGEYFQIVDTGGLVFADYGNTKNSDDEDESENVLLFAKEIRQQAMIAIEESAAVIMVVDGQVGVTTLDLQIAQFLRKQVLQQLKLPVLVAVNKCESEISGPTMAADFRKLGLGQPHAVSALHGVGTAELLETMFQSLRQSNTVFEGFGTKAEKLAEAKKNMKHKGPLPWEDETDYKMRKYGIGNPAQRVLDDYDAAKAAFIASDQAQQDAIATTIHVAIIGRPNVGKSSLLNALLGEPRAIVSDVAGTTRDSIDAFMERPGRNASEPSTIYRFVDTAGIRRKGKVQKNHDGPEYYMVNRALRAMRRADVVLLVLDATAGVTEQDRILAQRIVDDGRACVIVNNKWDAVLNKQDPLTFEKAVQYVKNELPPLRSWAPILFVSAASGQRVPKIFAAVDEVITAHRTRVPTSILNEVLRDAILWQPPPTKRSGAQAKIYYCHQVSTRPPTIVVFCNDPQLISDNYRRYLDRKFRESLGQEFAGTPIRWLFRGRRQRDILRSSSSSSSSNSRIMNGQPGDGGSGTSFPFPHAD